MCLANNCLSLLDGLRLRVSILRPQAYLHDFGWPWILPAWKSALRRGRPKAALKRAQSRRCRDFVAVQTFQTGAKMVSKTEVVRFRPVSLGFARFSAQPPLGDGRQKWKFGYLRVFDCAAGCGADGPAVRPYQRRRSAQRTHRRGRRSAHATRRRQKHYGGVRARMLPETITKHERG
jgi:hypothetical protein